MKGFLLFSKRAFNKAKSCVFSCLQWVSCHTKPPCLILNCDGGICSQIQQYVWGQILIDLGYPVKYDHTFFYTNAKDMYGKFDRSFMLDRLCVLPRMEIASSGEVAYYQRHYLNPQNQSPNPISMPLIQNWKAPLYLGNYYYCPPEDFKSYLQKYVKLRTAQEILDSQSFAIYQKITSCQSVGVHVRRGDMARNEFEWKNPTPQYFVNAIKSPEFEGCTFFFFSDEIDWVKENIIPKLPENINYYLVEANDSKNGYQDLYLLLSCRHQIASQGSFGVFAFFLNPNPQKLLMFPKGGRGERVDDRLKKENVVFWTLDGTRI